MSPLQNPALLRLLWAVIIEVKPQDLLGLSDTALVAMLLREASRRVLLSGEEVSGLYVYLGAHLPLIRDIASSQPIWAEETCHSA